MSARFVIKNECQLYFNQTASPICESAGWSGLKLWTKWLLLYVGQACCSAYTWSATKITRMSRSFAPSPPSSTYYSTLRSHHHQNPEKWDVQPSVFRIQLNTFICTKRKKERERGISLLLARRIIPRALFFLGIEFKKREAGSRFARIFAEHTAANVYFIIKIVYPFAARGQI